MYKLFLKCRDVFGNPPTGYLVNEAKNQYLCEEHNGYVIFHQFVCATMKRNYPVGIQNFEEIRKGNYYYIDKTELVYQLVSSGKYYFLSRPRRFGKSLLISTLEAYFQGKKELFKDLAIETLEKEWLEYPILHFDLNTKKYESKASIAEILNQHLEKWEAIYGDEKRERSPEERFSYIIEKSVR